MPAKPSIAAAERKQIRTELKEIRDLEKDFLKTYRKDIAALEREIKKLKRFAKPFLDGVERRRSILLGRLG